MTKTRNTLNGLLYTWFQYYILVFIIFVVMLVGGILLFVFRAKVLTTLEREMTASIPYYGVKHEYTRAWDDTQTYLQCCGVRSYKDWNDNVPESCCQEVYPGKVSCSAPRCSRPRGVR